MLGTHPKLLLIGWILLAVTAGILFFTNLFQSENDSYKQDGKKIISNGVAMYWMTGHSERGDHYRVELCYSLPDRRDWLLANPLDRTSPLLKLGGDEVLPVEEGTMYWRMDAGGQIVERCEYLLFFGQPLPNEKTITLQVRSLEAPKVGQKNVCQEIRDILGQQGLELSMTCTDQPGFAAQLIERMPVYLLHNDSNLRRPLDSVEHDVLYGDWSFTFPVNPQ